jgi:hypothetical protein
VKTDDDLMAQGLKKPRILEGTSESARHKRRAFVEAVVAATDKAAAAGDYQELLRLHEQVGHLWHGGYDLDINALDLGEYISLVADAVQAKATDSETWDFLAKYREGVFDGL